MNFTPYTAFQKSIVYGCLLGDGYLYKKKGILQIEQAIHHQDSLFWLFENLKTLTTGRSPSFREYLDKRTHKVYQSSRFSTRAFFHEWRFAFYNEYGKKKLPEDFAKSLNSTVLAVWFLDDGGRCSGVKNGVFLTLDRYTLNEIEEIQKALLTQFGIQSKLHFAGKSKKGVQQKRITITGLSFDRFYVIVYPLVSQIPSMKEKKWKRLPSLKTP